MAKDKTKLKQCLCLKPALQKTIEENLQTEDVNHT